MSVHYGVIADDFTGATDIASFMAIAGLRVLQIIGVPEPQTSIQSDIDVVVIALKSRSLPRQQAVDLSLGAAQWLRECAGVAQLYFKYCSTFDSTPEGNIGPVADALREYLGVNTLVHCPALPQNKRTVVYGHLFVNSVLLNQSGMENHPINPMCDAKISRLLAPQTQGSIGDIHFPVIQEGVESVHAQLIYLKNRQINHVIADTLNEASLDTLAEALKNEPFLAGGSGLGGALAKRYVTKQKSDAVGWHPQAGGARIILSGSCSLMTQKQVSLYRQQAASYPLDISRCIANDPNQITELVEWACAHQQQELAPLIYATQPADVLQAIQQRYGEKRASEAVEYTFAQVAEKLSECGFTTFIVAGGETSGTVVQSLGIEQLHIGPQIVPGVPWVNDIQHGRSLALKSGNFGDEYFFFSAQEFLK